MIMWCLPINQISLLLSHGSKSLLGTVDAHLYGEVFSKNIHQKRGSCFIIGSLQSHITELSLNHIAVTADYCLEKILAWKRPQSMLVTNAYRDQLRDSLEKVAKKFTINLITYSSKSLGWISILKITFKNNTVCDYIL